MQTYLGGYDLYGFNRQKASVARYIAKNFPASRKHQKNYENNVEHGSNASPKDWRDVRLLIVFHR